MRSKLVILVISTIGTLALFEVGLRLTESDSQRSSRQFYSSYYRGGTADSFFRFDPILGWTAASNRTIIHRFNGWEGRFLTDSDGLRLIPMPSNKREEGERKSRAMILADSFGFGMGANDEETIDFFLLQAHTGLALKNVSAPGWSPEQYFAAYSRFQEGFHPSHVYMLITHVNDFVILQNCTAYNRFKPTVRSVGGHPERLVSPSEMMLFKPGHRSVFWEFQAFYRVGLVLEPIYLRHLCGVEEVYGMSPSYEMDRLNLYSRSRNSRGEFDSLWQRFDFIIKMMSAEVTAHQARFAMVMLPLGEFSEMVQRRKDLGALSADFQAGPSSEFATSVVIERAKNIAQRYHLDFIYPDAEYREAEARGYSIYSKESHYGPVGNKIVAEAIIAHLGSTQ